MTLVGVVGTDPDATARIEELRRAGVDCAIRQDPAAPTGTVIVLTTAAERTMVTERGANLLLTGADVTAALAAAPGARHLHLSAYTLLDPVSRPAGLAALAAARERGLTTSVDAASAAPLRAVGPAAFLSWVRGVDLLLANGDEAAALVAAAPGADQARALTATARYAVVKLGAAGAVLAGRDTPPVSLPAAEVRALDTTGAGDAFAAGLLAAWVRGADPATALAAGIRYGAEAVTVTGGRPVRLTTAPCGLRLQVDDPGLLLGGEGAWRRLRGELTAADAELDAQPVLFLRRPVVGEQHRQPGQQDRADGAERQPEPEQRGVDGDQDRADDQADRADAHHHHVPHHPAVQLVVLTAPGVGDQYRFIGRTLHEASSGCLPILPLAAAPAVADRTHRHTPRTQPLAAFAWAFIAVLYSRTRRSDSPSTMSATDRWLSASP